MSRKSILYIAESLDGFIADRNGKVDWLYGADSNFESDYGYREFIAGIDTVVMGYSTYLQVITDLCPKEWIYDRMKSYVLTHKDLTSTEKIEFTRKNIFELIGDLKKEKGKNIWIVGGASVANQLIKADLIDEYYITIIPFLLGSGIRLFREDNPPIKLQCIKCSTENSVVQCIYTRRGN